MNELSTYSLYLYGSQGRGEESPSSDVDLLVLVNSTKEFDSKEF